MGGPINDIILCCQKKRTRTIDVRRELRASMMAHAYSRVRGKPGICMATSADGQQQSAPSSAATVLQGVRSPKMGRHRR
jgi:thiamine pyrophosphate-dependent acetolactate synthase large subunit-like protein